MCSLQENILNENSQVRLSKHEIKQILFMVRQLGLLLLKLPFITHHRQNLNVILIPRYFRTLSTASVGHLIRYTENAARPTFWISSAKHQPSIHCEEAHSHS